MGSTMVDVRAFERMVDALGVPPIAELLFLRSVIHSAGHHGVVWNSDLPMLTRGLPNPARQIQALVDNSLWFAFDGGWCLEVEKLARRCERPRNDRWKLTPDLRVRVLERDEYACQGCGTIHHPLVIDHRVPVADGGRTEYDNLQALCALCNGRKGVLSWEAFLEKWGR